MSNTPDEAKRLLDALDQLDVEENKYGRDGTIADVLAIGVARKMVCDKIIPLIRSGLAMQRLEQAMRETGMECANVGTNKDGAWCFLQCRDFSEPEGDGDTIPEAINAALDAAGVEK